MIAIDFIAKTTVKLPAARGSSQRFPGTNASPRWQGKLARHLRTKWSADRQSRQPSIRPPSPPVTPGETLSLEFGMLRPL
ncbi:MAG: hypothetical protein QM691_07265 [Opitutaceae bacterium]